MSFGAFEEEENIFDKPDHPMFTLFKKPADYVACEGSEKLEELFARTGEFMREVVIPELQNGKDVLIVGHGAMNLSIINRVYDVAMEDFWERLPGNCQMVELPVDLVLERFR